MDATNTKKLSLSRETLRILGDEPLKEVAGASEHETDYCWPSAGPGCSIAIVLCGI